jgi:hypothetical protein
MQTPQTALDVRFLVVRDDARGHSSDGGCDRRCIRQETIPPDPSNVNGQPLAQVQKIEDATRHKAARRLYYGHWRGKMAKQSHLKIVLQVALVIGERRTKHKVGITFYVSRSTLLLP